MKNNLDISLLTKREYEILQIMWSLNKPVIASDIPKHNKNLTISTVQTALKNLMSKGFIRVSKIVYSGTVLTRSYETTITYGRLRPQPNKKIKTTLFENVV